MEHENVYMEKECEDGFFEIEVSRSYLEFIGTKLNFLEDMEQRFRSLDGIYLDPDINCCHFKLKDIQENIQISNTTIESIQDLARNLIYQTELLRRDNTKVSLFISGLPECENCSELI